MKSKNKINKKAIGRNLRKYRLEKNWTQYDFGLRVGYSESSISAWERGYRFPDLETLIRLADELDVHIVQLLEGIEDPSSRISLEKLIVGLGRLEMTLQKILVDIQKIKRKIKNE
jgi:transcriptional regulator with XRE-family HTH domain